MIIGNTSLDPRKIIYAQLIQKSFKVYLQIAYRFGDLLTTIRVNCDDIHDAILYLSKIDKYAHKDSLVDAISDKSLEEIEDDLDCEMRIGFKQ